MTKIIAQTYNVTTPYRAYFTSVLFAGCLMAAFLYAISLYHIISRTVALEHVHSQSAVLTGQVEALDSRYLELSSAASVDALASYGLVQGQVSAYIPRAASTAYAASLGTLAAGGHEF